VAWRPPSRGAPLTRPGGRPEPQGTRDAPPAVPGGFGPFRDRAVGGRERARRPYPWALVSAARSISDIRPGSPRTKEDGLGTVGGASSHVLLARVPWDDPHEGVRVASSPLEPIHVPGPKAGPRRGPTAPSRAPKDPGRGRGPPPETGLGARDATGTTPWEWPSAPPPPTPPRGPEGPHGRAGGRRTSRQPTSPSPRRAQAGGGGAVTDRVHAHSTCMY